MTDIQYVQLDSSDFLADNDFQTMSAEQRGVFWSVLLFLYTNKGKLLLENTNQQPLFPDSNPRIALLSNCPKRGSEWEEVWAPVAKKFKIKNGVLKHKRVTAELLKARKYRLQKKLAGIKGMQHRYNTVNNTVITKVSKVKVSKGKGSKTKRVFTPPTLEDVKKYVADNPELSNVDPVSFWKGFNDGGWIDTRGNPVRNWKLKLRTWSSYGNDRRKTTKNSQREGAPAAEGRRDQTSRRDTSGGSAIGRTVKA